MVSRASHLGRSASCSKRNFERARFRAAVLADTRRSGVLRLIGPDRFIIPPNTVDSQPTDSSPLGSRSHERQQCFPFHSVRPRWRFRVPPLLTASHRLQSNASPTPSDPSQGPESRVRVAGTLPEPMRSGWLHRVAAPIRRTQLTALGPTGPRATNSGSRLLSDPIGYR